MCALDQTDPSFYDTLFFFVFFLSFKNSHRYYKARTYESRDGGPGNGGGTVAEACVERASNETCALFRYSFNIYLNMQLALKLERILIDHIYKKYKPANYEELS